MKSRVKMGAHSTNEVLFCLCLHRECFTMFYMFVSLSLSLCKYAVSFCFQLQDPADVCCVLWHVAALKLFCRMLGVS